MAFGLVCRTAGLKLWEAALFSLTNFAGSGQFLAISLLSSGAMITEMFISVLLVNLRYSFMGAVITPKLKDVRGIKRFMVAFGTTDEVFSVAIFKGRNLSWRYMSGLELISYCGWVTGTFVGFWVGMFLPYAMQMAVGVTLYAMFSSLLAQETRQKGAMVLLISAVSATLNSLLIIFVHLGTGWSFVISMLTATLLGAFFISDEGLEAVQ